MGRSPSATVAHALAGFCAAWLPLAAAADPQLAQARHCTNCHAMERKLIGPAWLDVARRYGGKPDAASWLATKIVNGGGGVWGAVPMPANTHVKADEAQRLALWILQLK